MNKLIFKASQKSIALFITIVIMLSLMLSGCSANTILQELANDYIIIDVSHQLLSESSDNEPLYTYQIDAEIFNNYGIDLYDAKISLNVPEDVEIIEGKAEQRNIVSSDPENQNQYTWIVAIKPTVDDRNIDYSVTVTSALITSLSSYESIFVDGQNMNNNRLDFSVDTWKFQNWSEKPIPITQQDYDALLYNLSNTDRQLIKEKIENGANGHCYGMAITTILVKTNRLNLNNLQSGASNLHSVSKNTESKSIIAYYYLTQFLNPAKNEISNAFFMDEQEKLHTLEALSENVENGGTPVLLCFYLISSSGKAGGHAVVAYGCESCKATTYDGKTYNNRILVYDNNFPNDYMYLYYNDTGDWDLLYNGKKDKLVQPYNTTSLGLITTSMELIDISNAEQNRESVYSYITSRDNANIEISNAETTWTINGMDTHGAEGIAAYYDIGTSETSNLNICIQRDSMEDAYTITSQDAGQDLDISISYDNFYISAKAEGDDRIRLSPSGSVDIQGETTDFSLAITANNGYAPLNWSTVTIDAQHGTNPKLEITADGYLLSGNNLGKVNVYAENTQGTSSLTLSTNESTILLAQDGENLCAKTDTDKDGHYETILVTGSATGSQNSANGFGLNWEAILGFGSLALIIILLVAGLLLASALTAGIVVIVRSKKNKKKKKQAEEDSWF